MLSTKMQFILLGSGSAAYDAAIMNWRGVFRTGGRAVGYDEGLAHRIEAGCRFLPDAVAFRAKRPEPDV